MMKYLTAIIFIIAIAAVLPARLLGINAAGTRPVKLLQKRPAQVLQSERKALQLREDQYTAGVLHGNVKLLADVWADTFVDTDEEGNISYKPAQLAKIASSKAKITSLIVDQERVDYYNNTAVVTERFRVSYQINGKNGSETGRSTDVWVKQNGKWMCVAAHSSAHP